MKCLITGINGVVGANIASTLRETYGWEVMGLGSSQKTDDYYFRADLTNKNDVTRVSKEINSCDIVVHCAAIIDFKCDPADLFKTNVIGSINAVEIAKNINAKNFINISSIPVIGRILEVPITEPHICAPSTGYHLSKLHGEQVVDFYSGSEIETVSLRIPSPVGIGMPARSFLPIILGQALRNEDIKIIGDKRRRQNFLDLRDLAHAVVNVFEKNNVRGIYNIAARKPISNLDLALAILKQSNSKSRLLDLTEESSGYFEDWNVDCTKAHKDFGYAPKYEIFDSIDWILGRTIS